MRLRCPHCQNAIRIVDELSQPSIQCTHCGSVFTLADNDETVAHITAGSMFGHFRLVELLGRGSFGVVWKARDTQLDRWVAVKIPRREECDNDTIQAFLREARAAAQLSHPNIVSIHEIGKFENRIYIVAEYIDGLTLKDWANHRPLPIREAVEICRKIAEAIGHAHSRGVIHRDLKPSNVLLDQENEPRVTDFGLARRISGEVTVTIDGAILGTLDYMPPEQASGDGHRADARSDIYSLGVVLFELLTGSVPFRGDKQLIIHRIRNEDPPRLRSLKTGIPVDLETICLKCIEKSPEKRYQTALDIAEELSRFLNGLPIFARPVGPISRLIRRAKRYPSRAAAIGTSGLLLLSFAIGGPVLAWQQSLLRHQQSVIAQREKDLREADEQRSRQRVDQQIALLSDVSTETAEVLISGFRTDIAIATPALREKLLQSENACERLRLIAGLIALDGGSPELVGQLVEMIPQTSYSDSRLLIKSILTSGQVSTACDRLLTKLEPEAIGQAKGPSELDEAKFLCTLIYCGNFSKLEKIMPIDGVSRENLYDFVNTFARWQGDISLLAKSLPLIESEEAKSLLCLSLGTIDNSTISEPTRGSLQATLKQWYLDRRLRNAHGAAKWTLRNWNEQLPEIAPNELSSTGDEVVNWYVNKVGMTFVRISGGDVVLGEGAEEPDYPLEVHRGSVGQDFWLSDVETTVGLYRAFLDDDQYPANKKPLSFKLDAEVSPGPDFPMQNVTLEDAVLFCNWLSWKDGLKPCYHFPGVHLDLSQTPEFDGLPTRQVITLESNSGGYRLPMFAEWELATRAGMRSSFFFGDAKRQELLTQFACYSSNSWRDFKMQTNPVGKKMPNPNGLFDIIGNVQELCWDIPPQRGEAVPEIMCSVRGGAFDRNARACLSGAYLAFVSSSRSKNVGFRVARTCPRVQ